MRSHFILADLVYLTLLAYRKLRIFSTLEVSIWELGNNLFWKNCTLPKRPNL